MPEAAGTATITITPEFTKDSEQMIREIVVDEVTKQMDTIALRITEAITEQSLGLRTILAENASTMSSS